MKLNIKTQFLPIILLFLTSCSLSEIKKQSEVLSKISYLSGSIENNDNQNSIHVVLLKQHKTYVELISQTLLDNKNRYQFVLAPGTYIVAAFIDENDNGIREVTEKAALYRQDDSEYQVIEIGSEEKRNLREFSIDEALDIKKALQINEHYTAKINLSKAQRNIGTVISLNDPIFSKERPTQGFWKPLTFLDEVGGGLFMLQSYEEGKIPIIFVHGIIGNPNEFKAIIQSLDHDKYQPWVLYYASGIQLDLISGYLLKSLNKLSKDYGFNDVYVVAHSMGGLMTRSFLMDHQEQGSDFEIPFYMTINSPLNGMKSAASGVEISPIVIGSWRDLAIGSDYINKVHKWRVPNNMDYHLVFSYLPENEGDGVVPLSSQLSLSLQDEATNIYGFQSQHANLLMEDDFIYRFNKILAKHLKKTEQ